MAKGIWVIAEQKEGKLKKVTLFLSGEPENSFPDKAFMSYIVRAGKAEKKQQVYEIDDLDPNQPVADIFAAALVEIKQTEGVV